MSNPTTFFWFRRDLRLEDNHGLYQALQSGNPVQPVFIFDTEILDKLEDKEDRRVEFIHQELTRMDSDLKKVGASLLVGVGKPLEIWEKWSKEFNIGWVFTNHDYEPYARERDEAMRKMLDEKEIGFFTFKDQVVFEKGEVVKDDGKPYTVFTPFSKKWKAHLKANPIEHYPSEKNLDKFIQGNSFDIPSLAELGFSAVGKAFPLSEFNPEIVGNYAEQRDYPAVQGTTKISVHLRFGTVSIRKLVLQAKPLSETWLNELIWREFYQVILWHFPHVVDRAFRAKYDHIPWRTDEDDFNKWCEGKTGYPLVDAGMRELNATGFMHNRVRMVTASFLTKHLLIDWRWGEAYFAQKLLDFDLASNNGGWQWAAGTGCDAAPYFRIFNPESQFKKFDTKGKYVLKWVPEFGTPAYVRPMVDHKFARERCLTTYKKALAEAAS